LFSDFPIHATLFAQAAAAKQAKLAALKKWTHINPDIEEIRLELEDKILNGLLTFDLASRQISPTGDDRDARNYVAERNGSASGTRSATPMMLDDVAADSGAESDLAPQVDELLQRLKAPPKDFVDQDGDIDDTGPLSDDWPSIDGDNDEGVADSPDEMEVQEDETIQTKIKMDKSPIAPESPQTENSDDTAAMEDADSIGRSVGGRAYDLGKIAETGHGGKIMFVFQKVSNGRTKPGKALIQAKGEDV
jgi:hypothetical protein